jgi:hypothetical protein
MQHKALRPSYGRLRISLSSTPQAIPEEHIVHRGKSSRLWFSPLEVIKHRGGEHELQDQKMGNCRTIVKQELSRRLPFPRQ